MRKGLVIFSGGQDSTTCLGWAKNRFQEVEAISFFYGQKHSIELERAKQICEIMNIKHHIIDISFFKEVVDSALTSNGDVNEKHSRLKHLPASFVPNRNAMFITIAHSLAQKVSADALITGVCQTDYSGYPDCRKGFIDLIGSALNHGSDSEIQIYTPLMYLTKKQTWELAEKEGVLELIINHSHTCYNGSEKFNDWGYGCGDCPACKLREKGWNEFKGN